MAPQTRQEFAQSCAAAVALGTSGTSSFASDETSKPYDEGFASYQERRRKELWSLLGDLPWQHRASPPKLVLSLLNLAKVLPSAVDREDASLRAPSM